MHPRSLYSECRIIGLDQTLPQLRRVGQLTRSVAAKDRIFVLAGTRPDPRIVHKDGLHSARMRHFPPPSTICRHPHLPLSTRYYQLPHSSTNDSLCSWEIIDIPSGEERKRLLHSSISSFEPGNGAPLFSEALSHQDTLTTLLDGIQTIPRRSIRARSMRGTGRSSSIPSSGSCMG